MSTDFIDPTAILTDGRSARHSFVAETHRTGVPAYRFSNRRAPNRGDEAETVHAGDLVLHYQPRVLLDTGIRTGAEALARWQHGKRGLIPPSMLMPMAEASGQVTQLGGWMLESACAEACRWGGLNVSVSVSARQLQDGVLLGQVADALDRSGLAPELLELAITESVLIDGSLETLLALSALRDHGVGLALDDYGSGAATLGMLKRLPLTALKMDRALVRDLAGNADDAAIARAIIQTAQALGFVVIADGVDTEAQRDMLAGFGCDEGQGLVFSPPVTGVALRARVEGSARERFAGSTAQACGGGAAVYL